MTRSGTGLDALAPEARFAARAVAAGLAPDDVADVLRVDGATARKHLRTAVRETTGAALTASADDAALVAALPPAAPPGRAPATRCPSAEILRELALGRLDGPLVLAEAEHAADCAACMTGLVAARSAGAAQGDGAPAAPPARGVDLPIVVGAAVGVAVVVLYLLAT